MTLKTNIPKYLTCSTPELAYAVACLFPRERHDSNIEDGLLKQTYQKLSGPQQLHLEPWIAWQSSHPSSFRPASTVTSLREAHDLLFDPPFKIAGYLVEIVANGIQVGCTFVTWAEVRRAAALAPAAVEVPTATIPDSAHNPKNLTPAQVGIAYGYRLLDKDEVKGDGHNWPNINYLRQIEKWGVNSWSDTAWRGNDPQYTFRTKLSRANLLALRNTVA